MRNYFKRKGEISPLDREINAVLSKMDEIGVDDEKYPKMMTYLERLHALKLGERAEPVSLDTLAMIGGNLVGILIIVAYEQRHVITSKGLTQLIRPR